MRKPIHRDPPTGLDLGSSGQATAAVTSGSGEKIVIGAAPREDEPLNGKNPFARGGCDKMRHRRKHDHSSDDRRWRCDLRVQQRRNANGTSSLLDSSGRHIGPLLFIARDHPLSVRISALLERKSAGSIGAARLLEIKQSRIDDAIGAILVLNTLAGTIGATLAGAQAVVLFGEASVGLISATLTVLLLIVSEIIPKTLATRDAD